MDKVTQSNAGNAEETAAAAEELNAQAQAAHESVSELLRLVEGGTAAAPQTKVAAPARKPQRSNTAGTPAVAAPTLRVRSRQGAMPRVTGSESEPADLHFK